MPKPVVPPIYLSTTYRREADGSYRGGYVYSRAGNPNRSALEDQLTSLEAGAAAFAFASGMAGVQALFLSLRTGDHVIVPDDVYFNVILLLEEVMTDWGLTYTAVDMQDHEAVRNAIRPTTRLIWLETPSNPQLKITDLAAIVDLAHQAKLLVAVDNTWPSPIHTRPLKLGADYVIHSTTKYMAGHSDVLGGALIAREANGASERIGKIQRFGGAVPSPLDCYLVSRGLASLELRVQRQSGTALYLAERLSGHPAVEEVLYPGLPSHPAHAVAARQMEHGFGGMLSLRIRGNAEKARQFATDLEHFTQATSLGGVESLIEHRKSVEGPNSSTPDNLLRLSIGLEAPDVLLKDLLQNLGG